MASNGVVERKSDRLQALKQKGDHNGACPNCGCSLYVNGRHKRLECLNCDWTEPVRC